MYSIDKIDENVVVAEDLTTREKIILQKENFTFPIYEGLLFSKEGDVYFQEKAEENDRRKLLREKMERLKRHE